MEVSAVKITNNEASYERNRRLMRVVSFFYDLMQAHGCGQERGGKYEGMSPLPNGSTPIASIHDHKGFLTVVWFSQPSETEMRCMETAWSVAGGEPDSEVEHLIKEVKRGI